jgi:uncharacterized membrane protein YkoI
MTAKRLTLIITALTAVICLSVWGAVTVSAADGASQPNKPVAAGNAKSDEGNGEAKDDNGPGEAKDDGPINPSDAEKAKAAALKIAGGGTVQDVEKGDDGKPGWYEVEIQKADGTEVKVQLDENFNQRQNAEESEGSDDQEGPDDD